MQLGLLSCVDVSFVFHKRQGIEGNDKGFLGGRPGAPMPDKYVDPGLNLIGCKDFNSCMSEIMKRIGDDRNALDMMQVTRPLGLRLSLR